MPKTAPILGLTSALATAFFFTQNIMAANYDLLIRDGTIYDGSGRAPVVGDVAINGDSIVAVGKPTDARGKTEIDASGLAVAPGFINMLS